MTIKSDGILVEAMKQSQASAKAFAYNMTKEMFIKMKEDEDYTETSDDQKLLASAILAHTACQTCDFDIGINCYTGAKY